MAEHDNFFFPSTFSMMLIWKREKKIVTADNIPYFSYDE